MTGEPTRQAADAGAVRAAAESVPDPELPPVTLGMLGMVHHVRVDAGGHATVELLPTFSGCPAQEVMGEDVARAVSELEGVTGVSVRFRFDPPWSSDRISPEGRRALAEFGIAPPQGPDEAPPNPAADSRGRSPLPLLHAEAPVPCPYCSSGETVRDSPFGPTPCRALHYCHTCRQPFEAFKRL